MRAAVTPLGVERQAAGAKLVGEVQNSSQRTIAEAWHGALVHVLTAIELAQVAVDLLRYNRCIGVAAGL